jgi:indole-3-glycerol phosphate synthase
MRNRACVLAASREEAARLGGQRLSEITPSRRDFAQYVATQKQELAIIARFAPTAVAERDVAQIVANARACDDAEVAALAVATGSDGFPLEVLEAVAASTTAPVLRDDLLVDPAQLYASRLHGADAGIFPAGDLPAGALCELVTVASSLHMASIIEVLTAADLHAIASLPHVLIGLHCETADGRLDIQRTTELARAVPSHCTVIALSEVHSAAECAKLRGYCDAVVAGDLLSGTDVAAAIRGLVES